MSPPARRPIAFIVAATNHGSMLVNRHDYRLVEGGGFGVGYQLLGSSAFDPQEVDFALQLLRLRRQHFGDGVVAIDCGANIGVHTIEWAREMYGWGSVTAFEAQERIFYALAGNITLNNCFNARAVWAAIGRQRGSIFVPTPDYFVPSSFGSLEIKQRANTEFIGQPINYAGDDMQVTPMTAIDDLLLDRLDFIKIDIEGMEMDALLGAEQSIGRFKPQLLIEKIKSDESEIRAFVNRHGYKIFEVGINLLAVHADDPASGMVHIG
jgi:FkbM family methyltransferase